MNKIIDTLPNVIKKNITTISILISVILSLIYILIFSHQYSLWKSLEEISIVAHGYYDGPPPFSAVLHKNIPMLVIFIIIIVLVWIFHSVVKNRLAEQNKEIAN